jgi:hypothetical protein
MDIMDGEIARRRNNEPYDLDSVHFVSLHNLSYDAEGLFVEQFIASLNATTTLRDLGVLVTYPQSTREINRRVIEPFCRCLANLRGHNQNHPLRKLGIYGAKKHHIGAVKKILVAAKQFGIHHLSVESCLSIQSIGEFCRDNTHLKVLDIRGTPLSSTGSKIPVSSLNSSAIPALVGLTIKDVTFENSIVATQFLNIVTPMTYPALQLGGIKIAASKNGESEEEKEIACMRILSELIKPSLLQRLNLLDGCPIEAMDAIEACATVTRIQLDRIFAPRCFEAAAVQKKLKKIKRRNRELACFVASPRDYPSGDELLTLMRQFDNCPTGRYMMARCFPGIPSFFKSKSTDSATAGAKKRARLY